MTVKKVKLGFAFHVHHNILMEYCFDYDGRVRAIKENKPKEEQELRLRLFRLIPMRRLPLAFRKAHAKWLKAHAEWRKDYAEWRKALTEWQPQIEKLHVELCPNCTWDGKTIFPKEKK